MVDFFIIFQARSPAPMPDSLPHNPLESVMRGCTLSCLFQLVSWHNALFGVVSSCCWYTGNSFPLEKVHEAIAETERAGRKGKVFLEG